MVHVMPVGLQVASFASDVADYSVRVLIGCFIALFVIIMVASLIHHRFHFTKKAFFTLIAAISVSTAVALFISHLALLASTENFGLERRTARIRFDVCGQQVPVYSNQALVKSLGNGRQIVMEEGRLIYLGYTVDPVQDASLGAFFRAMGAGINSSTMTLPYSTSAKNDVSDAASLAQFERTNPLGEPYLELKNGEACNLSPSMINVFVYRYSEADQMYYQERVSLPDQLVLSAQPENREDCIVVIYGDPLQTTNLTCGDYPQNGKISASKQEDSQ